MTVSTRRATADRWGRSLSAGRGAAAGDCAGNQRQSYEAPERARVIGYAGSAHKLKLSSAGAHGMTASCRPQLRYRRAAGMAEGVPGRIKATDEDGEAGSAEVGG